MADTPTADTPYIEGKNVVIEMDATKAELPRISRKFKLTFAAIVFILLNGLALYLLHFLDRGSKSQSTSILLSSASFGSNGANQKPVSFAPNGTLRVGAGTTAYLDAAALPSDTMQYINTVRMGTTQSTYATNILTYYLPSKLQSVVTTVTANADKTLSMAEAPSDNVLSGKTIRGPLTPLMRMSPADFTLAGAAAVTTPTAVTLDLVPTSTESFVVGYTGMLGPVNPKRLSLVETYGNVAGIGSGSNGVTVTGSVSVSGSLTTGQAYYATTRGDIVTVTQTDADYFYTAGDATIVTKSSKIGVAVSGSDLYVAPMN
ncbi:hypothetical protein SDRG_13287 [Saprolegnia diclina VS20]|uniref:Uncharacterized protein n=1 Tax=Saprolegnia diclina (strain VS20) TaxID=1156394 RepID=T0Q685_SAPDV|nr:hypothetical protein SDRG_13287 [Saprolegnia diclina VS20]EQC28950.1 hypothetical protein SDRG_13287 [Saprolegnia diclina VS20]|eukprot:XP_008617589.1 hypothetical protein SDRG_13287 [Saprolegnia diclina VS20]